MHRNDLRQGLRYPLGRALVGCEDTEMYRAQGRVVTKIDSLGVFDSCRDILDVTS